MNSKIFNIYCDESCHLENDGINVMILGAIWCPETEKKSIFEDLKALKKKHGFAPYWELKWNAVSPQRLSYYKELVQYYFLNPNLHFRALVVSNKNELDHNRFNQTHDEFYYKMYFDLLKTIFDPDYSYNVFIDIKDTRGSKKISKLHEYLCNKHYDFDRSIVKKIQQVRSHEVELIQLSDFLTGAVGYINRGLTTSNAKIEIVELIRSLSGYSLTKSTLFKENKMNIFVWKGGYWNA